MSTPQAHPVSPDAALEAEINLTALRLATAATPKDRRAAWNDLCALHEQRSEEQVRRLERERGLDRTARG